MSVSFEVAPPLRLYRTTAQGRHYSLNIYIGRDYLDQTNLPFFDCIRQIRSLRIRCLGWTLVAELMGGAEEQRQQMECLEELYAMGEDPRRSD